MSTFEEAKIPQHLLSIGESFNPCYTPVHDFEGWRIAMLRHFTSTAKTSFNKVERHNETNEVFILTTGEADLIIAGNSAIPDQSYIVQMRHNVAYNIPAGVWHHVIMSTDAHIILVEKTNTSTSNSDYYYYEIEKSADIINAIRDLR
jgi:ureidoglycolate hydrolase